MYAHYLQHDDNVRPAMLDSAATYLHISGGALTVRHFLTAPGLQQPWDNGSRPHHLAPMGSTIAEASSPACQMHACLMQDS